MLESEGVKWSAVHALPHSWNLDDLVSGKVDALSAYLTDEPYSLQARGVEPVALRPLQYGVDFYGDLLFTTAAFAEANPGLTEAFRQASFRGWDYAMDHPEELIDLILTLPGVAKRGITREHLRFEAEQMRDLVMPGLVDIGHVNPGRFRRIAETSQSLGLLTTIRDPQAFIFEPQRPLTQIWLARLGVGLGVAAVVGFLGILWIWQLKRTVGQRTRELQEEVLHRREAEASLAEREQRLRLLVEHLPAGAVYIDDSGFYVNAAVEHLTGHGRADLSDLEAWLRILDPVGRERLREAFLAREHTLSLAPLLASLTRKDGSRRTVEISMRPLAQCEIWLVLDVTAREAAEAARRASEDRYRGIYLNSSDLIKLVRVEPKGRFVFESVNPSFSSTYGIEPEAFHEKTPEACLPKEVAQFMTRNFQSCVAAGRNLTYEEVLSLPTGKRTFQTQLAPIRDSQGRIYLLAGISRDLTDERRSQEALRQAQKLESLGVLAGGIAHDFNNLLSAVLGNLNLAQLKLPPGAPSEPYLKSMETTILRAADLTRQMLAYSGKGRFVVESLDVSRLVQEITHLLSVSISKKVVLRYELAEGLPAIEADSTQIQQVMMNLVTNASEAIGDREGIITITTGVRDLDTQMVDTLLEGQRLEPGRYVVLTVSDTGCGMTSDTMSRIFDPFFTTKTSGRGLGLSAMLGILRGHGAGIKIYSEPGKGSVFQVYFQSSGEVPRAEALAEQAERAPFHGQVLLVDDEADLRASIASMLEYLGFEVVVAGDGQEALDRFSPGAFVLVLMDLTMPRLDGREAFRRMKEVDPSVRVILSSGYNEQEAIQQFLGRGLAGFLQKPYQLKTLIEAIEKALRPNP